MATTGDGPVQRSTVVGNTVIASGHDGIHVASPDTMIADNLTVRNAAYGIEAVPGVTDGGHNHAIGNGASPQCLNITYP